MRYSETTNRLLCKANICDYKSKKQHYLLIKYIKNKFKKHMLKNFLKNGIYIHKCITTII